MRQFFCMHAWGARVGGHAYSELRHLCQARCVRYLASHSIYNIRQPR